MWKFSSNYFKLIILFTINFNTTIKIFYQQQKKWVQSSFSEFRRILQSPSLFCLRSSFYYICKIHVILSDCTSHKEIRNICISYDGYFKAYTYLSVFCRLLYADYKQKVLFFFRKRRCLFNLSIRWLKDTHCSHPMPYHAILTIKKLT